MEYLGLVVEEGKISTDPIKVKGFADWPIPTCVKDVRSFLGFGNFYRKFIPGFLTLAAPLNALLKKDTIFQWTEETQRSFDALKQKLTSSPVLMMPDQTRPFQIEWDASKYASGAVLTQQDNNGDRHPVAFLSKTFSETERNYKIYDRELLAITYQSLGGMATLYSGIWTYHDHLFGSPEPHLFQVRPEIELKTGTMVSLSVRI